MTKIFLLLQSLVLLCTTINGQPLSEEVPPRIKSIGLPFMTTYGPSDYNFTNQNFDVLIGNDHKVYFANFGGILVFDGVNWTQLTLPKEAAVYGLKKAKDGTIYVGGINEIGYLSNKPNGELAYISLNEKLGGEPLDSFTSLVFVNGDTIIFSALKKTILFNHLTKETTIIDSPEVSGGFYTMHKNQGVIYGYARDSLFQLNEEKWETVKQSSLISSYVFGMGQLVDINHEQTIAITQNGFFDFETERKIEIDKGVERFLKESNIYNVRSLRNEYIVICTWSGLMITDSAGNPILHLNKKKGLPDDFLFGAALDDSGMLWVATNNGLVKIDLLSPSSIFDERMGVEGVITDTQLHNGDIYLTSMSGVFREQWEVIHSPLIVPTFEKMASSVSHGMINSEKDLFIFTELQNNLVLENGVLEEIEGTRDEILWAGLKYKDSDDLLLGSLSGKLFHLSKPQDKWKIKKEMYPSLLNARLMVEGEGNDVWVSNLNEGIFKLTYDKKETKLLAEKKYSEAEGLPSDLNNYVFTIDSKPCFVTSKGIYKYDVGTDRFVADEQFSKLVGEEEISLITDDEKGNIYYFSDEFNMLRKTKTGYEKMTFSNIDFLKYLPMGITAFDSKNIIISSLNACIHIDPTQPQLHSDFEVNFTKISSLISDSVLYGGFGKLPVKLSFSDNDNAVRLKFSAAFYQNIDQTSYKWRLKGLDNTWSSRSSETTKDYTNLPHGDYTFEVIALNVHGVESSPATIQFTVETPWFFTWWAYLIYAIIATLFIWIIVKMNSRRLIRKNEKLEGIISDRTKEISKQKDNAEKDARTISSQHKELQEMDELKGRFFLNISHELRTPLTLAMGTVDQALRGKYGALNDELYANLKSSFRNNQRLLKMVNNILDISKLESGDMNLQVSKTKPSEILSRVTDFFSSKFLNKKVELRCDFKSETELYLDKDKFETIFINLIANAFKFTSDGGFVSISISEKKDALEISVEDNGIGIPKEEISFVFDRFYQSSHGPSDGGTGLGLALTKELVELHKGDIVIESEINLGTKFIVTFLKGKEHFEESQIIEGVKSGDYKNMEDKNALSDLPQQVAQNKEKNEIQLFDREKPHILLVEDNPEMSRFVAEILSSNYNVTIANNGQEGLEFLEETTPDLILTDYLMPIMNGYEMASEIKKSEKLAFIPMIFLTARTGEQDKIEVLNLGVDDYLFKPFNADELQVRINNLLNTKNQRIEFIKSKAIDPRDIEWKEFPSKLKLDIDDYIKTHIKEDISGDDLANFTKQSERSLYRKIKVNTGLSLMQYIKEYRLRQARRMLENREVKTVSEVAYEVGFNYLSHFTKNYKERFGRQPSEYLD